MTTTADTYEGGVTAADFPPDLDGDDSTPLPPDPDAPYGWTTDKETGERRPKKRPGRPAKPPGPEELAAAEPPPEVTPDREPQPPAGRRRGRRERGPAEPPGETVAMPRAGVIAAGINKLYRRTGHIYGALFDRDIGDALVQCATPDPEGDWPTTGEAWENLARTNPRIRAALLRLIAGGTWGELLMAHAPLGMAIIMKPAIQRRIPAGKLAEAFFTAEPGEDTGPGGLTPEDVEKMAAQAGIDLDAAAAAYAATQGGVLTPPFAQHNLPESEADRAGNGIPAGFTRPRPMDRQQPKRPGTRSQRTRSR
jgi:hypothetical protein